MVKMDYNQNKFAERIIDKTETTKHDDEHKITTAISVQEVDEIRDIWNKMQPHPCADIDYYLLDVPRTPANILISGWY